MQTRDGKAEGFYSLNLPLKYVSSNQTACFPSIIGLVVTAVLARGLLFFAWFLGGSLLKCDNPTPQMQEFNRRMSAVRVSVEWLFGNIVEYFKFIDFKKNLKIGMS